MVSSDKIRRAETNVYGADFSASPKQIHFGATYASQNL